MHSKDPVADDMSPPSVLNFCVRIPIFWMIYWFSGQELITLNAFAFQSKCYLFLLTSAKDRASMPSQSLCIRFQSNSHYILLQLRMLTSTKLFYDHLCINCALVYKKVDQKNFALNIEHFISKLEKWLFNLKQSPANSVQSVSLYNKLSL